MQGNPHPQNSLISGTVPLFLALETLGFSTGETITVHPGKAFFRMELHSWTVLPVLGAGYVQGIWVEIRISSEICVNDMFSNLNVAKSIAGRNCI